MPWLLLTETDTSDLYARALDNLKEVFTRIDDAAVDAAVAEIIAARRIFLYACGREKLQIMGFCMWLYHLGFDAAMAGNMTTPPVGPGDLLFTVCGPGYVSTTSVLIGVAAKAGARTLVVTAQPEGATARLADVRLVLPAQTMADDRGGHVSVLPMGSVMEAGLFILFKVMVLKLMAAKVITYEQIRTRHTSLE